MKKKILFVIPSLRSGGAEKSLITLLSLFDYDKYDVDLLTFRKDGLFYDKIPKEVNVIKETEDYEMFDSDAKTAIRYFLKKGKLSAVIDRLKYIKCYSEPNMTLREEKKWGLLKKQLPEISKKYDCAVGYLEGNASAFAACVNADKKICYVHSDIKKLDINKKINGDIFGKCDSIVTVSKACADSLADEFPQEKEKIAVIENITSPTLIRKDAQGTVCYGKDLNILTIGRFSQPKGIDLAVKACAELKKRGCAFIWYHIGMGELKAEIENLVKELQVEENFVMLGERSNPYPYIAQCDIYVQPSRYEGKSIAIDEAKCLAKPIVTTDFTTVDDQINDGINGLICEMNELDMADKIEKLLNDEKLRAQLSENLLKEKTGNEDEIEKLYLLFN